MITSVNGIKVGHATDKKGLTGCTVILCPPKTTGGCEIRGGAPGSRETALLASEKTVSEVHAVLFSGGSAFGLAAADGVMRYLEEAGIGYETPWGKVPIVPSSVVFDLYSGDPDARPNSEMGYQACTKASTRVDEGRVGAGTGTTIGKWAGLEYSMKGGIGTSSVSFGDILVGSLAVVNSIGDVVDENGKVIAGARDKKGFLADRYPFRLPPHLQLQSTTLVCVATNAKLSKVETNILARRTHNALALSIRPSHTSMDGDTVIALSTGEVEVSVDVVAEFAIKSAAESIRRAVTKGNELLE